MKKEKKQASAKDHAERSWTTWRRCVCNQCLRVQFQSSWAKGTQCKEDFLRGEVLTELPSECGEDSKESFRNSLRW